MGETLKVSFPSVAKVPIPKTGFLQETRFFLSVPKVPRRTLSSGSNLRDVVPAWITSRKIFNFRYYPQPLPEGGEGR